MNAELFCRIRNGLPVIPAGNGDHASPFLRFRKLAHEI